ncbi:A-kinase anchor protein 12 [Heterocephalus glaber]|nr:A-kinase anchor protein 12 [Heterocephalus glaber]
MDKSPLESREDKKEDAAEDPTLADPAAPGGLTKESPDTNGPKLTAGAKGGRAYSESEKDIKPQTEEEQRKGGREPAES